MAGTESKKNAAGRKGVNSGNTRKTRAGGLSGLVTQHQAVAVDSLLRLLSEPLSSLMTWAVIGIALALPLTLLLLLQNLQGLGAGLDQSRAISMYLQKDLGLQQQQNLVATLGRRPDLDSVTLITAEQSLAEFREASGLGNVLDGLEESPLPAVLQIIPQESLPQSMDGLIASLADLEGVDSVEFDMQWLQRLDALVALATNLALVLAGMLGLGVLLVIGNTVRLAIENRRAEIVVVKLVGGTDAYVARPFLYAGLWYGAGGGMFALLLVFTVLALLRGPFENLLGVWSAEASLVTLSPGSAFGVLAVAAMLGWIGAQVSVWRNLRAVEPD